MKAAFIFCIGVVICFIAQTDAETGVDACPSAKTPDELKQSISIAGCKKSPCKFKKHHKYAAEFKFTPDKSVKIVKNRIYAIFAGTTLQIPFIPYDDANVCDSIYESDGTTKAQCPLAANKQYIFKIELDIQNYFPIADLLIHWALQGHDGVDLSCFEIKGKIRN